MRGYMSGEKILVLLWIAAMFFWGKYAPLLTPYVRNLIGIVTVFAALCLFCAVFVIYWKLAVIIWGVIVGTFFFAEKFPKNPEKHLYWRQRVTFLQDLFVIAGSLLIVFEIFILVSRK